MVSENISLVEAYYRAIAAKQIDEIEQYLHAEVRLTSPLVDITGKDGVLKAMAGFAALAQSLKIRTIAEVNGQVLYVYDVGFAPPIGMVHAAGCINIQDRKIIRIELFFDARPFQPGR